MSSPISFPYTTGANYTYDSNKIEVIGGVARLRDQRELLGDGNVITAATYTANGNLNYGDAADKTITLVNGAAISSGSLDLTANSGGPSFAHYSGADLTDDMLQTGTVRILIQPQYSNAPGIRQSFINVRKSGNQNAVIITHETSGQLKIQIVNDSSGNIINKNFGSFSPTSGTNNEIEINFDITAGAIRLFVDGIQLGTTDTSTGTRTSDQNQILLGDGVLNQDFKILEFSVFNTVQHVANYTIGESIPETIYVKDNPTIVTNLAFKTSKILTWVETALALSGSDLITHLLNVAGQSKYAPNGVVTNSDGTYAQSSVSTDMDDNLSDFHSSRATTTITTFLHSDDGSTRPSLDLLSLTVDAVLPDPSLPTMVDLEGFIYNALGNPVASKIVQVRPFEKAFIAGGVFCEYAFITWATTNVDGHFEGQLADNPDGEFWEFKIGIQSYKVDILKTTGVLDFSDEEHITRTVIIVD